MESDLTQGYKAGYSAGYEQGKQHGRLEGIEEALYEIWEDEDKKRRELIRRIVNGE